MAVVVEEPISGRQIVANTKECCGRSSYAAAACFYHSSSPIINSSTTASCHSFTLYLPLSKQLKNFFNTLHDLHHYIYPLIHHSSLLKSDNMAAAPPTSQPDDVNDWINRVKDVAAKPAILTDPRPAGAAPWKTDFFGCFDPVDTCQLR